MSIVDKPCKAHPNDPDKIHHQHEFTITIHWVKATGEMTWAQAKSWAEDLNHGCSCGDRWVLPPPELIKWLPSDGYGNSSLGEWVDEPIWSNRQNKQFPAKASSVVVGGGENENHLKSDPLKCLAVHVKPPMWGLLRPRKKAAGKVKKVAKKPKTRKAAGKKK